ncbi:hypothetical protein QTI66_37915 [Variovorax sp. J22R133]|uniref:hypothetical protein n=1 Tax=Variovorax brevis TaxID=3053503 RepID=UPI002574E4F3|nr:hypothetical protein [Variovorax sp. J22R133]MDM0117873.1 hypothetical protein [Variovorax sp. J22R133]
MHATLDEHAVGADACVASVTGLGRDPAVCCSVEVCIVEDENRHCGPLAAKSLMKEGGVIACEAPRDPFPAIHPAARSLLTGTARRLDAMVLLWAR